ncbi:hypothetical protein ACS0TY_005711 [Phlomoides rotata]
MKEAKKKTTKSYDLSSKLPRILSLVKSFSLKDNTESSTILKPLKKEKEEQFEPKINEQITAPFVRLPLKKEKEEQFEPKINEQITAPFVRLVTEEGHDVVPRERAMAQAKTLGMDLVEERSNQALMKKNKECRSGMEIMKFLQVDMREFLNAPNGKQSPPVNNRKSLNVDGFNKVVFVCEILDCCPCFDFSDLELICDINARDHTGQTTLHWSAVRGTIQVAKDEVAENHCKGID